MTSIETILASISLDRLHDLINEKIFTKDYNEYLKIVKDKNKQGSDGKNPINHREALEFLNIHQKNMLNDDNYCYNRGFAVGSDDEYRCKFYTAAFRERVIQRLKMLKRGDDFDKTPAGKKSQQMKMLRIAHEKEEEKATKAAAAEEKKRVREEKKKREEEDRAYEEERIAE
jgi:hypothetical protein